jgi:peptidyl-prolyl cis-trans isomerase D
MIKLIHRYNKVITYVFLFIAVCFMFSGVGLDILHNGGSSERYAIKVNNKEVSPLEFERAKENLTERYRRMFGDKFDSISKTLNLNITEQTIDSIVDSNLLSQEADKWGLVGSDDAVNKYLVTKIFAGQEISKDSIRMMLQNLGMNYKQFSAEIKNEVSRGTFSDLLRDVYFLSDRDVSAKYSRQETAFSLQAATVPLNKFDSQIAKPSDEALQAIYNETATNYELPARVSYEYLVFSAKDFAKDVPVTTQDVELYYTENPSKFKTPDQAKIKSITLLYPKEIDPKAMADVKAKAKTVHEEAVSGKPFTDLVQKHSDDMPTKLASGSKGWIERGKGSKAFDKAVFSTQAGQVAELIESNTGYEIVFVEEKMDAGQKPFAEVKQEIENLIRNREAPAFAAAKAQEVVTEVRKGSGTLAAIASSKGLPAPKVVNLGSRDQDPDPLLTGLTQKALQLPAGDRLIATTVDIGDATVAMHVKEFKEPTIQPLSEVKGAVIAAYRAREALKLAEKQANDLLEIVKKEPNTFESAAKERGLTVSEPFNITRANPTNDKFADLSTEISNDAFNSSVTPRALGRAFKGTNGYTVAVVTKVTKPDPKSPSAVEALKKYRDESTQKQEQEALVATIALLKSRSDIDIDKGLMAR